MRALPPLLGQPLRVEWASGLRNVRGCLQLGGGRGKEVYAASFLRERRMVFDEALRRDHGELIRIMVHELFHFAWVRLSNDLRETWKQLVRKELVLHARGELGWSAESRKCAFRSANVDPFGPAWSQYCCESYCDSAAWLYADSGVHEEFTLAPRFREIRRAGLRTIESHRAGAIRI